MFFKIKKKISFNYYQLSYRDWSNLKALFFIKWFFFEQITNSSSTLKIKILYILDTLDRQTEIDFIYEINHFN